MPQFIIARLTDRRDAKNYAILELHNFYHFYILKTDKLTKPEVEEEYAKLTGTLTNIFVPQEKGK